MGLSGAKPTVATHSARLALPETSAISCLGMLLNGLAESHAPTA
jgi:hypothetical protein